MQRLLNREEQAPVRKVEINRAHPIIAGVAQRLQHDPNDPVAQAVVEQLYASAMLLDGMAVDPAELVARMQTIMQAAVK